MKYAKNQIKSVLCKIQIRKEKLHAFKHFFCLVVGFLFFPFCSQTACFQPYCLPTLGKRILAVLAIPREFSSTTSLLEYIRCHTKYF